MEELPYEERQFHHGHARLEERDGQRVFICLPQGERGGYDLRIPADIRDPWRWFAERGELGAESWSDATKAAVDEIEGYGYIVDLIPEPRGWRAVVGRLQPNGVTTGRDVAIGQTREEAALQALRVVHREVESEVGGVRFCLVA